jgi:catechol 2,3-dioxygenase-like lactoylglutathione lyase family enzyme
MAFLAITHVALRVTELREAETYYCALFDLQVAFREAETADGWLSLPEDKSWDDAQEAGISLGLVLLYSGPFVLALEAVEGHTNAGRLSHIGLLVDLPELDQLRRRAADLGCQLAVDRETLLVVDDVYGVRWEVTTMTSSDPRQLSTGARLGKWLSLGK